MMVCFPAFLAVNWPDRINWKILVRDRPELAAASSGLRPSRGTARPVTFGCIESIAHIPLRSRHRAARYGIPSARGCVFPGFFSFSWKLRTADRLNRIAREALYRARHNKDCSRLCLRYQVLVRFCQTGRARSIRLARARAPRCDGAISCAFAALPSAPPCVPVGRKLHPMT
jgi:hypothetical protein